MTKNLIYTVFLGLLIFSIMRFYTNKRAEEEHPQWVHDELEKIAEWGKENP